MNRLRIKSLACRCAFIIAIVFLFAGTIPQIRQVIPALALTTTPLPFPDLVVQGIIPVQLGGSCENRWGTNVTISNNSTVPVNAPFIVRLNNTQSATVNSLAAFTTATVQFTNGYAPSNTVTVDATNVIVETFESNNTLSITAAPTPTNSVPRITCTPGTPTRTPTNTAPGMTDLTVVSLTGGLVGPACAGQKVTSVTIRNSGSLAVSSSVSIVVRLNNTQDQIVNGIAAGQSITLQYNSYQPSNNIASVDATNALVEYNENNNSFSTFLPAIDPIPPCTFTPTSGTPVITNTPVTPTATFTPTRVISATACPVADPIFPMVEPVVSPTNALSQNVVVKQVFNTTTASVTTVSGTFQGTRTATDTITVPVQLNANTTHNLTVTVIIPGFTMSGGCTYPGWTFNLTRDRTNNPLTIVQQSGTIVVTPSRTPTRVTTADNLPGLTQTAAVWLTGTAVARTRTAQAITPTRTPTLSTTTCSPLNATITAPFTFDGAGTFCWRINNIPSFINSWNLNSLTVNGVNWTNLWASPSQLPPKAADGYWYISYNSSVAWGHFEAK